MIHFRKGNNGQFSRNGLDKSFWSIYIIFIFRYKLKVKQKDMLVHHQQTNRIANEENKSKNKNS